MTLRFFKRMILVTVVLSLGAPILTLAQEVKLEAGISFLEGPTIDRDGNVYFTDLASERIMKWSEDGVLSTYRKDSNVANGMVIDT